MCRYPVYNLLNAIVYNWILNFHRLCSIHLWYIDDMRQPLVLQFGSFQSYFRYHSIHVNFIKLVYIQSKEYQIECRLLCVEFWNNSDYVGLVQYCGAQDRKVFIRHLIPEKKKLFLASALDVHWTFFHR